MNKSRVKSACSLTSEQLRLAQPRFLAIVRTGCCGRSGFVFAVPGLICGSEYLSVFRPLVWKAMADRHISSQFTCV